MNYYANVYMIMHIAICYAFFYVYFYNNKTL